jgi:hypothetical protein
MEVEGGHVLRLSLYVVIARFMRATHFALAKNKLGRPDKPGDDGLGGGREMMQLDPKPLDQANPRR